MSAPKQDVEFSVEADTADEGQDKAEAVMERFAGGRTWRIHEIRAEPSVTSQGQPIVWEIRVRGEITRDT